MSMSLSCLRQQRMSNSWSQRLLSCAGQPRDQSTFEFASQLQEDTHLYQVSDIFASDFAFNKFNPEAEVKPASASARRLFQVGRAAKHGLQAGSALLDDY